ncbi:MAG: exonuclease domain-containing protein [bacterium]|nr:exonuclease domain-containing protein [bacterium]
MIKTDVRVDNYVVIDIENPNTKADSICSIAFIHVKDGKIVNQKYTLVNPEDRFDEINMKINGINSNMVNESITLDKFWNEYHDIFENNIIIGHGIKYDISVITKALAKYNISMPITKIICTQKLAQKYLDIEQYKLNQVCDYLSIDLKQHHDALCDTTASLKIFQYIDDKYGIDSTDIEEYNFTGKSNSNGMKITYSNDTKGLQNLKKIIESIMVDSIIETEEINLLNNWLDNNIDLIGNYPFDKIYYIVKSVLEDGIISDSEYNDLMQLFNEFINPIEEEKSNAEIIFNNMTFCLTGTFNCGSKDAIEDKIVAKGGICGNNVTSKTNYLIVGGSGSEAWKFGNYGGKVQKAMELKEKGRQIEIISEEDFINQI